MMKAIGLAIMLVVMAITLAMIGGLIHEGVVRLLGQEVPARLVSIHERRDSGGAYSYTAKYEYSLNGGPTRADESRISFAAWHRLSKPYVTADGVPHDIAIPQTASVAPAARSGELGVPGPANIQVYAYKLGSLSYSRALEHEWGFLFLLIPALFAPTLAFLSFTLYLAMVIRPDRQRWLYTHGAAVLGTITGQYVLRSRYGSETYFVNYAFHVDGQSEPVHGNAMLAGKREFDEAVPGKTVTVLYNPAKPKHSTMAEYGGYTWA